MRFLPTVIASILGSLIAFSIAFFFGLVLLAAIASSGQVAPVVQENTVLVVSASGAMVLVALQDVLEGEAKATANGRADRRTTAGDKEDELATNSERAQRARRGIVGNISIVAVSVAVADTSSYIQDNRNRRKTFDV